MSEIVVYMQDYVKIRDPQTITDTNVIISMSKLYVNEQPVPRWLKSVMLSLSKTKIFQDTAKVS